MAEDNVTWGYTRIPGALHNLGHELSRSTIKRILYDAGIVPAPSARNALEDLPQVPLGGPGGNRLLTVEVLRCSGSSATMCCSSSS